MIQTGNLQTNHNFKIANKSSLYALECIAMWQNDWFLPGAWAPGKSGHCRAK